MHAKLRTYSTNAYAVHTVQNQQRAEPAGIERPHKDIIQKNIILFSFIRREGRYLFYCIHTRLRVKYSCLYHLESKATTVYHVLNICLESLENQPNKPNKEEEKL